MLRDRDMTSSAALQVVWATVGDRPAATTYQRLDQPRPRLGVTLMQEVPLAEVPAEWVDQLWPDGGAQWVVTTEGLPPENESVLVYWLDPALDESDRWAIGIQENGDWFREVGNLSVQVATPTHWMTRPATPFYDAQQTLPAEHVPVLAYFRIAGTPLRRWSLCQRQQQAWFYVTPLPLHHALPEATHWQRLPSPPVLTGERRGGGAERGTPAQPEVEAARQRLAEVMRKRAVSPLLDPALAAAYRQHGQDVTAVSGNCWFGKTMVGAPHDGVPYCLDAHGSEENIPRTIRRRGTMVERHHARVKVVYDYLVGQGLGPLWVLVGGGLQLQAFFGNESGYLATLYLDLEELEESVEDDPESRDEGSFTLQVEWARNDVHFQQWTPVDGILLQTHREVWGEEND